MGKRKGARKKLAEHRGLTKNFNIHIQNIRILIQ
jgi:hypothetical protein